MRYFSEMVVEGISQTNHDEMNVRGQTNSTRPGSDSACRSPPAWLGVSMHLDHLDVHTEVPAPDSFRIMLLLNDRVGYLDDGLRRRAIVGTLRAF